MGVHLDRLTHDVSRVLQMTTGVEEVEKWGEQKGRVSKKKSFVGIHQNAIVPIRLLTSTSGGKSHVCKNILPALLLLLRLFLFFNFPLFFFFSLKLVDEPLLFSIVYVCCLFITFLTASNCWRRTRKQAPHARVTV